VILREPLGSFDICLLIDDEELIFLFTFEWIILVGVNSIEIEIS
jgi:hypothetical protein